MGSNRSHCALETGILGKQHSLNYCLIIFEYFYAHDGFLGQRSFCLYKLLIRQTLLPFKDILKSTQIIGCSNKLLRDNIV